MSIIIQNVSTEDTPLKGYNNYQIRINDNIICNFTHKRKANGLAQCLRDAADAVEAKEHDRILSIINAIK